MSPERHAIAAAYLLDEESLAEQLFREPPVGPLPRKKAENHARRLVKAMRARGNLAGLDALLHEYRLSEQEGVVLMCLAEAVLRVPDAETRDLLIKDKIGEGNWARHLGHSDSFLVNASSFGLLLTGRLLRLDEATARDPLGVVGRLVARSGEPVIRAAVLYAIRILARQFVLGRTIEEAMARAGEAPAYRYSFDMLGEGARTRADAERYEEAYAHAVTALAGRAGHDVFAAPSISVKLSALHPRFVDAQRTRVLAELVPRVTSLARKAMAAGIGLTVDAEEADRLELTLDVFEALASAPVLAGWNGLGLAVQAYQKRALPVIAWLAALARKTGRRIPLRLVKGAYWDSEIKRAQERGLADYPVFTRKATTDLSYLACVKAILFENAFYPQFATHNAHTLSAILALADTKSAFEFQRLYGMGETLYDTVMAEPGFGTPCRIYAPVGGHEDLLAYLVRRLLENGANTSFVNRIADKDAPLEGLIADPAEILRASIPKRHPRIPLPRDLFRPERVNAQGLALDNRETLAALLADMKAALASPLRAAPLVDGQARSGHAEQVRDPADRSRILGEVVAADEAALAAAAMSAAKGFERWDELGGPARAAILDRAAALYEENRPLLMALLVREAGRTIPNALSELREATDFLRYYAAQARRDFSEARALPGPAGEENRIALRGRGVFACISPWNFPLSIFTGQLAAALAAGNTVLAKPAEQTPLVAAAAIRLLHKAGVPPDVLHLLPGTGESVGAKLVARAEVGGVVFTGSTDTARAINSALAARSGPIVPFIAETGGINALIVDSSALPEQVVDDALLSAYDSAGQRCSSARVLFLQEDIADKTIAMLAGALAELRVGDPMLIETDVGPIIDEPARKALSDHAERIVRAGKLIAAAQLAPEARNGNFFAPMLVEIPAMELLTQETFGPILHVVRFARERLEQVCAAINATGYGLTLGLHTRIDTTIDFVQRRVKVGNMYVNRSQIGAVVGCQPFGGEGLSGTGPKAGGPHYLQRFATERVISINTAAAGGNAALLSLEE